MQVDEVERQTRMAALRAMFDEAAEVLDPRSIWLLALGRVVNAYGELQSAVTTLIWELLDSDDHTLGQIVASDLQDLNRTNMLCSLIRFRLHRDELADFESAIDELRRALDHAREERNGVVHAQYVFDSEADWQDAPTIRLVSRSRGKALDIRTMPFDLEALISVIVTIGHAHRSLTALIQTCFPGQRVSSVDVEVRLPKTQL